MPVSERAPQADEQPQELCPDFAAMFWHNILPLQRQAAPDVHVVILDNAGKADQCAVQNGKDLMPVKLLSGINHPSRYLG